MSDTTTHAGELEPLWTDEDIIQWLDEHWDGVGAAEAIAKEIRATLTDQLSEARERIATLEAQLSDTQDKLLQLTIYGFRNDGDGDNDE